MMTAGSILFAKHEKHGRHLRGRLHLRQNSALSVRPSRKNVRLLRNIVFQILSKLFVSH